MPDEIAKIRVDESVNGFRRGGRGGAAADDRQRVAGGVAPQDPGRLQLLPVGHGPGFDVDAGHARDAAHRGAHPGNELVGRPGVRRERQRQLDDDRRAVLGHRADHPEVDDRARQLGVLDAPQRSPDVSVVGGHGQPPGGRDFPLRA